MIAAYRQSRSLAVWQSGGALLHSLIALLPICPYARLHKRAGVWGVDR
jgi:hypothetical protein